MVTRDVLIKKASDASIIFDYLAEELGITDLYDTSFIVNTETEKILKQNYLKENPFPNVIAVVLAKLRKAAVNKLFKDENIYQTACIASVLALCSNVATKIGELRGNDTKDVKIYTDISFAGLQAIRLYMANYLSKDFKKSRLQSALRVDNAINGSFYKYETKDHEHISFHTYYQSQQYKLVNALELKKESEKFTLMSTKKDRRYLTKVIRNYDAKYLEDLAFECGACASIIRSRSEWEATEVGNAVKNMKLISFNDERESNKAYGELTKKGPLAGIKVLDLTHIIAGPACSRILAEYGADVLLVRRGDFLHQEQAMLELDGWAGKNSIQLDFNKEEDLERCKELIKEADVITYSYQNGCMDKFGLSKEEILKLNPNVIYSSLMCFSDTVWADRPGWAPLAEDITGLSVRNGSKEHPVNLNGVPLDYLPGFILALGTLIAIERKLETNKVTSVTTSLTRGAMLLHEVTDYCHENKGQVGKKSSIIFENPTPEFKKTRVYVDTNCLGKIGFPAPATYNSLYPDLVQNMTFEDGQKNFK